MSDHAPTGFIQKYIFSFDHKVIGVQYIVTGIIMALVAAALAALIRIQLTWSDSGLMQPETYLAVVTMHGTLMIFFVISLALVSGLGNLLIPLQIGARDMAYPLLNMLSYWIMVPACIIMIVSFFVPGGAAASGWTAYPPLSAVAEAVPGSGMGQTLWLLAMALFIVSFTMSGLNFIVTVLNMRAKGMTMRRMPLNIWMFFVSAVLGVLSFPALTAAAVLLLMDRHLGTSFYLPEGMIIGQEALDYAGGTPLLFQHLFWFLGHPEVYVIVLPAIGVAFEILTTYGRRRPFGYRTTVYSLVVIGFLSMIVWGHHMFASGMNPYLAEYFSISTVLITLPFAVVGVNLLATLWRSRIRFTTAMCFGLGLVSAVGLGGFGGLFLGTATSDVYLHETYFVVGHFHLMIGTVTFFALFGGIYHWFPKMFGRLMNERLGRIHFWMTCPAMLTIWVLMHLQGMGGLIRRYYDHGEFTYAEGLGGLNLPITLLSGVLMLGQFVFLWNFFKSAFAGEKSPDNPWDSTTLEWTTPSPPGHGNWQGPLPDADRDPYDYGPNDDGSDFVSQGSPQSA